MSDDPNLDLAVTLVRTAQRFPDPVKRRRFAVERVQAQLHLDQPLAEALIERALMVVDAGQTAPAPVGATFSRGEPIPSTEPAEAAEADEPAPGKGKESPRAKKAQAKVKAGKKPAGKKR